MSGPRRLGALVLLLATAACAPALRPPPPGLPSAPADLLAAVRAAQAGVQRVQGRARLEVSSPRGGGGMDEFVAAERPGRLRLDSADFFGNVLAALAVDGGELALYDARQKVFYRGPATPENLARLVPLALPPADLVALLCGSAALLDGEALDASPSPDGGALRLTLRRGEEVQRVDVGEGAVVLRSLRSRRGTAELEAVLSGHQLRAGVRFPGALVVKAPPAQVELGLRWKEVEVNGEVDPALFRLAPPAGARVVDLPPAAPFAE